MLAQTAPPKILLVFLSVPTDAEFTVRRLRRRGGKRCEVIFSALHTLHFEAEMIEALAQAAIRLCLFELEDLFVELGHL